MSHSQKKRWGDRDLHAALEETFPTYGNWIFKSFFFWQMPNTHPSSLAPEQERFFCSYRANNRERGCMLCVSGVCVLIWVCVYESVCWRCIYNFLHCHTILVINFSFSPASCLSGLRLNLTCNHQNSISRRCQQLDGFTDTIYLT